MLKCSLFSLGVSGLEVSGLEVEIINGGYLFKIIAVKLAHGLRGLNGSMRIFSSLREQEFKRILIDCTNVFFCHFDPETSGEKSH